VKKIIAAIIMSILFPECYSQQVSGLVKDSSGTGIELATVALLKIADSTLLQSALTNEKGEFILANVADNTYLLKIFLVGYKDLYEMVGINEGNRKLPVYTLKSAGVNLNEITISTLKKLVEFKNGNVTVNIEDSPLAIGNSAWDLLIRLPGVTVDENKDIAIQGRSGAKILIDGRVQRMTGRQLENILRSMNASNIEKIEILKNPPLKYDAQGTAGLINIKTKKVKLYGFSGNVDYTYSQGFYGNHYGSLSLNYKSKKLIFYSNLSPEREDYFNDHVFYQKIQRDSTTSVLDQRTKHFEGGKFCSGDFGVDWLVNKKNTLGIKAEGGVGSGLEKGIGTVDMNTNEMGYHHLRYDSYTANDWDYFNFNLNAEHLFDTVGSKLIFSMDYSPNFDTYPGQYSNWFLDDNDAYILQPYFFSTNNILKNNILSSTLDLTKKINKSITLEAGLKGTGTETINRYVFQYKDNSNGEMISDPVSTNDFLYKEQLAAGYVNFSKEWEGISLQGGVRGENTHIEAYDGNGVQLFKRDYFNLFPAVSFQYSKNEAHNFQLSYNRRIERPDYMALTPFTYRNSLFQSFQGNPAVAPEYSNSFEISHTFADALTNSFSYSLIDNFSLDYTLQDDSAKTTTATVGNLKKADAFGYNVFFQGNIKNWWSLTFNGNAAYLRCSGRLLGEDYKSNGYFYMANLTNEFLFKGTKVELNARYIGPQFNGIWLNQPRWGIYLAVKRSFFKEKLSVVMGVDDVFFTMISANRVKFQNQDWYIKTTNDSRRFKLSISYNFGKIKVQQREVRSNDDEKGRTGH
jgi:iron complex outermembrane recepter protein